MIKSFSFIILLLSVFSLKSVSQEIELPLTCDPVIKNYLVKRNQELKVKSGELRLVHLDSSILHLLTAPSPDTLSLPFVDDFSKPVGIYPDPKLWLDSGAFINTTYGDSPPTVGVATFDGIDKYGNPYIPVISVIQHVPCDTLTSHCINLGGLATGDNVYLSFYYQPQGLGIAPYTDDSLVLEFRDPTDTITPWHWIWSHAGDVDMPFQRVNIKIGDSLQKYLYNGFQFHFYSYAVPNGNRSHWNIDYVMLDKGRSADSSVDLLTDVGFINPPTSILNEYQSMPWQHYETAPSSYMKASMTDSVRCINFNSQYLTDSATIWDANGNNIFTSSHNLNSGGPFSVNYFAPTDLTNFTYPPTAGDSVTFMIKDYIHSPGATNPNNDTVYYHQNFFNYYAYDDGSAESHYGLTVNGAIAYQYDIKKADTLLGLQIYFNPTGYPVHSETFEICYWTSLSGNPYRTTNLVPANMDSINGFVNYYFDVPQSVSAGTIYVGVIQDYSDPIGIGVDKNTGTNYTNSKVFYNIFSQWYPSTLQGYLMMRPLLGKDTRVGINETTSSTVAFGIYPNPAAGRSAVISYHSSDNKQMKLKVIDIAGREIYVQQLSIVNYQLSTNIDVSNFSEGLYFVQLIDERSGARSTQKLLIQH